LFATPIALASEKNGKLFHAKAKTSSSFSWVNIACVV
jgi:hypothetical protein